MDMIETRQRPRRLGWPRFQSRAAETPPLQRRPSAQLEVERPSSSGCCSPTPRLAREYMSEKAAPGSAEISSSLLAVLVRQAQEMTRTTYSVRVLQGFGSCALRALHGGRLPAKYRGLARDALWRWGQSSAVNKQSSFSRRPRRAAATGRRWSPTMAASRSRPSRPPIAAARPAAPPARRGNRPRNRWSCATSRGAGIH